MLVSHRKKFIFTKTVKTAGTSLESHFEKYCMPDGEWQQSHAREEYISDTGIIGYRGSNNREKTFFNHMSAASIRSHIGQDVWNNYFKFTSIRNPFDKMVSGFHMFANQQGRPTTQAEYDDEIMRFRAWIQKVGGILDRDKYIIDGQECIDFYIRFESLNEGIESVCDYLDIPFEPSLVPEFKKGDRHYEIKTSDYYDEYTKSIVENVYAWELKRFGYSFPK